MLAKMLTFANKDNQNGCQRSDRTVVISSALNRIGVGCYNATLSLGNISNLSQGCSWEISGGKGGAKIEICLCFSWSNSGSAWLLPCLYIPGGLSVMRGMAFIIEI